MTIRFRKLKKYSTNVRIIYFRQLATRIILKLYWNISPAMAKRFVKNHFFKSADYRTTAEQKRILGNGSKFQIDMQIWIVMNAEKRLLMILKKK